MPDTPPSGLLRSPPRQRSAPGKVRCNRLPLMLSSTVPRVTPVKFQGDVAPALLKMTPHHQSRKSDRAKLILDPGLLGAPPQPHHSAHTSELKMVDALLDLRSWAQDPQDPLDGPYHCFVKELKSPAQRRPRREHRQQRVEFRPRLVQEENRGVHVRD